MKCLDLHTRLHAFLHTYIHITYVCAFCSEDLLFKLWPCIVKPGAPLRSFAEEMPYKCGITNYTYTLHTYIHAYGKVYIYMLQCGLIYVAFDLRAIPLNVKSWY